MKKENIIKISSLSEFIETVKEVNEDFGVTWFRGHEKGSYTLTPSIFREPYDCSLENDFLLHFQSKAIPYLNEHKMPQTFWEWMFLMQHYGVPTRLLDWTTSAVIALTFATLFREDNNEKGKHYGEPVNIWCLNPLKMNEQARIRETSKIPNIISDDQIQSTYNTNEEVARYPVAIFGPLNNSRIVAQKGVFTLFPYSSSNIPKLEEDEHADSFLKCIVIEKQDEINTIKKELSLLGMSETTLFPDLSHLSLELKRELTKEK